MNTVQELERQLSAAREAEQARKSREYQAELARQHAERVRTATPKIRSIRERVDHLLAAHAKAVGPAPRPSPETRGQARHFLHSGLSPLIAEELPLLERLCGADSHFGALNSLLNELQHQILSGGAVGDVALANELDDAEILVWAALVERARFLAGEA